MLDELRKRYACAIELSPTYEGLLAQHHELVLSKERLSEALQAVLRCISLVEDRIKTKEDAMDAGLNVVKMVGKEQLTKLIVESVPAIVDKVWEKLNEKTEEVPGE